MNEKLKQEFLESLQRLDEYDADDYTPLPEDYHLEALTSRGALIDEVWLPLSQMRVDRWNVVYLRNWLYKQYY